MSYEVKIHAPADLSEKWYVYIYSGGKIIKKFYKGLAKEDNYADRMLKAEVLQSFIERDLKKGWNPEKKGLPQPEDLGYNIIQAFDFAFEIFKGKLAKKTFQDYSSVYRAIKPTILSLGWQNHDIKEFDSYHIKILLDKVKKSKKWSNKRYNKASNVLRSIFTALKKEFIIKNNPVQGLDYLPEETPIEMELITPEEQTLIIQHFNNVCPNFNIFLKILYHCGSRPNEIRQIKCSMIDFSKNIFLLPSEITKTKARKVPFSEDLKNDLLGLDLSNPDYYLFGIQSPYCRRKDKLFKTSPYQMSINIAGNLWREHVKGILGINKKMYGLKHKGANDKEDNGMNIETVKQIFGHSSEKITQIYATKHQEREFEKARAMMPKFK